MKKILAMTAFNLFLCAINVAIAIVAWVVAKDTKRRGLATVTDMEGVVRKHWG